MFDAVRRVPAERGIFFRRVADSVAADRWCPDARHHLDPNGHGFYSFSRTRTELLRRGFRIPERAGVGGRVRKRTAGEKGRESERGAPGLGATRRRPSPKRK